MLPGPVRLGGCARYSAGTGAVSQLVLVQYLRDLLVVAGHPGSAVDLLRQEAVQENSGGNGNRRTLHRRTPWQPPPPEMESQDHFLAKLLSGAQPDRPFLRKVQRPSVALPGHQARREVDARAVREV